MSNHKGSNMERFSNLIDDIDFHGISDINNYFFNDEVDVNNVNPELKLHYKSIASSLFDIALVLSKELNLDTSKTFMNLDYQWDKITFYNESDDNIVIYVSSKHVDIDIMEIYIHENGGVFKQNNIIMSKALFTGQIIKGCDMFKNNS